jgi:NADPH-dependent 2,4-dienoyl-CoA reductase/sulfur reductase-like enzyme
MEILMKKYKYLIVGGGMAGDSAIAGIRELDTQGSILLISAEPNPPYNRPPLSKGLWKGKSLDTIWRKSEQDNVEIVLNRRVISINLEQKSITDKNGTAYGFEKILLATGGVNRRLSVSETDIIYYRTVDDFKRLKKLTEEKQKFAVIGMGFIGSEISAALAMNGKDVTVFDIGAGIGWNIFPSGLTGYLNKYFQEKKVRVLPKIKVKEIEKKGEIYRITTESGFVDDFEAVVAGIGILPEVKLANEINVKIENGIIVNEYLQTTNSDVYSAGDVTKFYNPLLDKRIRVEHSDNAKAMGKQAGRNMAGAGERYDYLPFFYSDLFDLGYEAVGITDSRFEIIEDWEERNKKGVLYYLNDGRVKGVILWNVWDKLDEARKIIGLPSPVKGSDLIGRISG